MPLSGSVAALRDVCGDSVIMVGMAGGVLDAHGGGRDAPH